MDFFNYFFMFGDIFAGIGQFFVNLGGVMLNAFQGFLNILPF